MSNTTNSAKIVTRFAPSPTGLLHAGNYRTALFSYLFARKNGGKFILRIEDTDRARSKKEYEENIIESLTWLGLEHDDEIVRQSERVDIHKKYLKKLIADGHAYVSKESPLDEDGKLDTTKRTEVIRFKNPNIKVKFTDLIRGEIEFDTTELKDFVIAKNLEEPLFHLVVVVDDFEMGITHVVRGEDHISNTPRQILIQRAIGASQPTYAHLPIVLAPDRTKLSKRRGALAMTEYRERGYLPEALVNYMAMLGWNPGTEQEIFTKDELIKEFDLSRVQKSGAIFNEEKLQWMNKEYMRRHPTEEHEKWVVDAFKKARPDLADKLTLDHIKKVTPLILERSSTLGEIQKLFEAGELVYLIQSPEYEAASLLWKDEKDPAKAAEHLAVATKAIEGVEDNAFTQEAVKNALWDYASKVGRGNVLWPMRYALSGQPKSPDPFILAEMLGKSETLKRIETAIAKLKS